MPSSAQTVRNKIGGKVRQNPGADVTGLRRDLEAAKLEEHIREVAASAPPLTAEQRSKLAVLLLTPGGGADA